MGHALKFFSISLFSSGSFFGSGSFFSSSLRCLSFSLSGSLGLSSSLTLSSDGGSLSFVEFLLAFETLFLNVAELGFLLVLSVSDLCFLSLEPLVELNVGLFLADSALLNTNLEVAFQENTLIGEDATASVARLSTILKPLGSFVNVEDDGGRVSHRIVRAYFLNKSTVSRCTTIRNNDMIERLILFTMAL